MLLCMVVEPRFAAEVAENANCESSEFAEILFQPVPFSKNTPKGKYVMTNESNLRTQVPEQYAMC